MSHDTPRDGAPNSGGPGSAPPGGPGSAPPDAVFSMLLRVFGDAEMAAIWSEHATVEGWLRTEAALARAQAAAGELDPTWAERIAAACTLESIDLDELWGDMANVGYPILGLVRQVVRQLPEGPDGAVHLGATTQDIMDTGLALQLRDTIELLDARVAALGDALADRAQEHAATVMAGRTHGQQAVPTTLGAKLAISLRQALRLHRDLAALPPDVCQVSLFGAAGTSAGLGAGAPQLRAHVAASLGLEDADGPRHVARDGIAALGAVCARAAALCSRIAREVIDLSRTEIGEVAERGGHHRGASSTMPQKANPIASEAVVGMAVSAASMAGALYRAMEAGHERAAGEWHIEWHVLPQVTALTAGALDRCSTVVADLVVDPERMAANLRAEQGRTMAEAYMLALAASLGRERAHDVVYEAARRSRAGGTELRDEVLVVAGLDGSALADLAPRDYLGDSISQAHSAVRAWRARS